MATSIEMQNMMAVNRIRIADETLKLAELATKRAQFHLRNGNHAKAIEDARLAGDRAGDAVRLLKGE